MSLTIVNTNELNKILKETNTDTSKLYDYDHTHVVSRPLSKAWEKYQASIDETILEIGENKLSLWFKEKADHDYVAEQILNLIDPAWHFVASDYRLLPAYLNDPIFDCFIDEYCYSLFVNEKNLYEMISKQAELILEDYARVKVVEYVNDLFSDEE